MRSTVSVKEVVLSALRNNISGGVDLIGKLAMGSFVVSNIEIGKVNHDRYGFRNLISDHLMPAESLNGEYKKVCHCKALLRTIYFSLFNWWYPVS